MPGLAIDVFDLLLQPAFFLPGAPSDTGAAPAAKFFMPAAGSASQVRMLWLALGAHTVSCPPMWVACVGGYASVLPCGKLKVVLGSCRAPHQLLRPSDRRGNARPLAVRGAPPKRTLPASAARQLGRTPIPAAPQLAAASPSRMELLTRQPLAQR